ncbi:SPOC domain/Transcription elongation factor S-II protein [Forsythia ovata]|uniref:SPOC domain/Transcription elongation factor S-II protein n=1 Tax=Forsythia ovata TaxID=205694 RepID=A0ABD1W360_9LAMI
MEHVSTSLDLPTSEMKMRNVGQVPSNDLSHRFTLSNEQMGVAEPMSSNLGFQNVLVPNNRQNELDVGVNGSNAFWMPNEQGHDGGVMQNIQAGEKSLLPSKRKAEGGPGQYNFVPQQSLMSSKRATHMGANINSPGLTQLAPQKRTVPMQSKFSSPGLQNQPLPNKKMVRNESMSSKSGGPRGQYSKRQTSLIESGSKVQTESSEAVRSKMRESLADALSLAFQKQDKDANSEKKQTDTASTNETPVECQSAESNLTTATPIPGFEDSSPSKELATAVKPSDSQVLSAEFPTHESSGNGVQAFREFHYGTILPDEDVSFSETFFVKDDLLQGNGLSWALDFDVEVREGKEAQNSENAKSVKEESRGAGDRGELASLTPINLAFKIEAELFKVFGGVNKKYKEKGRSLLFNLKDRNNPELRERVVSGEISPERLCSMSAEELASKELSEWRMAKAEELAQMVVLPDTDIRRLVKKTHKGEYQVEVERDYSMAAEVSGGSTVLTQLKPKKETETHSPSKADNIKDRENVAGQEKNSENQDFPGSLVIPTDGTDLMQGMMVDDELKDADFLPPIVSLDEFMESLNSEPPFDNLPADADKTTPISRKESPEEVNNSKGSKSAAENSTHTPSKKADESLGERKVDVAVQSNRSSVVQKGLPSGDVSEVECLWEGVLQLNISSLVTVGGQFQSGEKTSTKEWTSSLEIVGRVRLDAFEKFFRELPMSRTRAVMILHFVLKNKQSENERTAISEAVDSYVAEDRLGFVEPAPGVELYLCPPSSKMLDMLSEHHSKMPNTVDDGLIGVVVWRRRHISNTISPNSSSHHKHSSKKQPFAHLKGGRNSNNNKNISAMAPVSYNTPTRSNSKPQEEEDDDIPPGFGPVAAARAAKEDDDLPEFNFSGEIKPSVLGVPSQNLHRGVKMTTLNQNPQLPVDQVRELIQKYGQTETRPTNRNWADNKVLGVEPWKDDDDDDIPEWRPNAPSSVHHLQPPLHGFRPPMHTPLADHHLTPPVAQQLPRAPANPSGLASWPPGSRWVQPPGRHPGTRWRH